MGRTARDVMVRDLVTVRCNDTVRGAARRMVEHGVGSVLVVDEEGRLEGIVTEGDFVGEKGGMPLSGHVMARVFGDYVDLVGLEEAYRRAALRSVEEVMVRDVATVPADAPLEQVVNTMLARGVKRLPVVEGGLVVGIVSRHDLLRVMVG